MNLQEQVEAMARQTLQAAQVYMETRGSVPPMVNFYAYSPDDGWSLHVAAARMPATAIEKDRLNLVMQEKALEWNACATLFLSEIWCTTQKLAKPSTEAHLREFMRTATPPKQDPNRQEAVLAILETYEGVKLAQMPIERHGNRARFTIHPFKTPDVVTGRFVNFLPPKLGEKGTEC